MKTRTLGILFLGLLLLLTFLNFSNCNKENGDISNITVAYEPNFEYGILTDSFKVTKGIIKPGQVLGEILYLHHIDHVEIDNGSAWQEVKCDSCKATWQDVYKLTGYDNLEKAK